MSALVPVGARRYFGDIELSGLLAQPGVLEVVVSLWADDEARELLTQAADAEALLSGDADAEEYLEAKARLDDALAALGSMLRRRRVRLGLDAAIDLREALIVSRLGQGRADDWQARRRIA